MLVLQLSPKDSMRLDRCPELRLTIPETTLIRLKKCSVIGPSARIRQAVLAQRTYCHGDTVRPAGTLSSARSSMRVADGEGQAGHLLILQPGQMVLQDGRVRSFVIITMRLCMLCMKVIQ